MTQAIHPSSGIRVMSLCSHLSRSGWPVSFVISCRDFTLRAFTVTWRRCDWENTVPSLHSVKSLDNTHCQVYPTDNTKPFPPLRKVSGSDPRHTPQWQWGQMAKAQSHQPVSWQECPEQNVYGIILWHMTTDKDKWQMNMSMNQLTKSTAAGEHMTLEGGSWHVVALVLQAPPPVPHPPLLALLEKETAPHYLLAVWTTLSSTKWHNYRHKMITCFDDNKWVTWSMLFASWNALVSPSTCL